MFRYLKVGFILLICLMAISNHAFAKRQKPLVWDMVELEHIKKEGLASNSARNILTRADRYCDENPVVITDQQNEFVEDRHFYFSMAPYRWLDPAGSGKYIWKDGEVNPDYYKYGSTKLVELSNRCQYLSKAYYLTRKKKYYNAFLRQIRAWFIDEETYMYPSFEYAQVIPGVDNNKGNPAGQVEAYSFNTVIESIRLVHWSKRIDRKTMKGLRTWFLAFIEESENRCGALYNKSNSNIALSYDVTLINMYLFAGKESKAKELADRFADRRINIQILENGSQPDELKRTNAFSYSLVNLIHMLDGCALLRYWDKDYYFKYGERIDRAFDYLQRYIDNPENFPYQQIAGWDSVTESFKKQHLRKETLRTKR